MKRSTALTTILALALHFTMGQTTFTVQVTGKGEPVFLFPGFGCPGEVWEETAGELSKTYECHIFTFAGFGNVPAIEIPWLPKIKDEIISYTNSLQSGKPVLIGHSLGGTLSLWLTSSEPNMFKKAIVVDALTCTAALLNPNYRKGDFYEYDNPQSNNILNMSNEEFKAMNEQSVPFMCLNKEKQNTIVSWLCMADRKTYVYGYVDYLNLDLREDISKIKIPVIILAATAYPDKNSIQATYNSQYQKLPGIKILYADNSAHFIMFDQPEWFIEKIKENVK